jgi:DNA-directed RNA polymerase subunit beta'
MSMGESANNFGAVKIGLASPYDIRNWSFGEVKKPKTIDYRTYRPEKDGLSCERIFGPEKDWECACGKYIGAKYRGIICDRCGVKVTHSGVRRKRMGHIELAAPVVHIWFFKAMPSHLGTLLDMKASSLERVIYFQDYVVVDPGDAPLEECQLLTEEDFRKAREQFGDTFQADMGADAVRKLLARLDLVQLSKRLRQELTETSSKRKMKDLTRRLEVVESLRDSDNRTEWMVLEAIPVIPPDLRPLSWSDEGNFFTCDLDDLYRRILNRNRRLKLLVDLHAHEVFIRNEKRMLQQDVDALFDNKRCRWPVLGTSRRPLKSLTDMIKGKMGRSRESLVGKRVDYSGRSVVVVGPGLRLDQCGLPRNIALELFQPFIIRRLRELGHADTIKSAKKMLERKVEEVWDILGEVMRNHPVLLNRRPTLQRSNLRAFFPILVEGGAIQIPPLACEGFSANLDGDLIAVHLPLSIEAQVEAMMLMMPSQNIESTNDGRPTIGRLGEILLGLHYMTSKARGEATSQSAFHRVEAVHLALGLGRLELRAPIRLRLPERRTVEGTGEARHRPGGWIETTAGRVIFNDALPPRMPYYNFPVDRRAFWTVLDDCRRRYGQGTMVTLIDDLKMLGFRAATRSGMTLAMDELRPPPSKAAIVVRADIETGRVADLGRRGEIGEAERRVSTRRAWCGA